MKTKTAIMLGVVVVSIIMFTNDFWNNLYGTMAGCAYSIIGIIAYALCRSAAKEKGKQC